MRNHTTSLLAAGLMAAGLALPSTVARAAEKIDLGNGRFQLALDPAVGTQPPAFPDGVIEWEYAGQATYATPGAASHAPAAVPFRDDDAPSDLITRLMRSQMEDEHGRLFRVKRIDRDRLTAALAAYRDRVEREVGREGDLPEDSRTSISQDADPVGGFVTPLTWYESDLDGDGSTDVYRWNSDDRIKITSLSDNEEKLVVYFFGDIGKDAGSCSGVLIGDHWVLTAMHCVMTDGLDWIYAEDSNPTDGKTESYRGKVCTRGNILSGAQCANVTARWGNGSWNGDSDPNDDLAVMKIDKDLGYANWMALSTASDSYIKDYYQYLRGFPGVTPSGGKNISCTKALYTNDPYPGYTSDSVAPCGANLYGAHDEINYAGTKMLGTRVDAGPGQSGSAIYYFPSTGGNYVTGILSGHIHWGFDTFNGGPKMNYHGDWVKSIMASN